MRFIHEISKTITLSTLGAGTAVGTTINIEGLVYEAYVKISKAVGANSSVTIDTTDGGKVLLKVTDPSTLGAYYLPRKVAVGTTMNDLSSTAYMVADCQTLNREKVRFTVASSSGLAAQTVTAKLRWI